MAICVFKLICLPLVLFL